MLLYFLIISLHGGLMAQNIFSCLQKHQPISVRQTQKKAGYAYVNACMQQHPYPPQGPVIIDDNAWHELGMDTYVNQFDHTQTAFGSWGMKQWSIPIADIDGIKARQDGIAILDRESDLMQQLDNALHEIRLVEKSIMSYYDEHDALNRDVQQLYYHSFKVLNESKIALDYAYLADSCAAIGNLAGLLCVNGLISEFFSAQMAGRSMHFMQGIKQGFSTLIARHNPGDMYYNQHKKAGAFVGNSRSVSLSLQASRCARMMAHIKQAFCNIKDKLTNPAFSQIMMQGSFGDRCAFFTEQCNLWSPLAYIWVLGNVFYTDYALWSNIKQQYNHLAWLYKTHVALQHRLVDIAHMFKCITDLLEQAEHLPVLKQHPACKAARKILQSSQDHVGALLHHLNDTTFHEKKQFLYSRGHVLRTHTLMAQEKDHLISIFQAVGIIDAYVSLAKVYTHLKDDEQTPVSFADISVDDASFCINQGWLPLIPSGRVPISLSLAAGEAPRNLILSGPNGGGKSSVLKLLGASVVLAHSWGFVPAASCRMSLFHGCYTSFNPQEDVTQGISTFMAQHKQLQHLSSYVTSHNDIKPMMLLVDEPYRGTIEAEAEKRAYQFGASVAHNEQCILGMATHLKQPLYLAYDLPSFANKHMQIERAGGTFKRTFALLDGPAWWWFNDIEQRMACIDWLHADYT